MYEEVFAGLTEDPAQHFETTFDEHHEEMVLVRDIPFYSMCEHHLAPFFGVAHVATSGSDGRICGLSKLARLVDAFAKRPQSAGTSDLANRRHADRTAAPAGRDRGFGGRAQCMTHARCEEARHDHHHQRRARRLREKPGDARRGTVAHLRATELGRPPPERAIANVSRETFVRNQVAQQARKGTSQ